VAPRPGRGNAAPPELDLEGSDFGPATSSSKTFPPQASPRFRHLVRRLHALGPRPVGELLLELARAHGIADDIARRLEVYAALDPTVVAALDGQDWPSIPPLVVPKRGSRR
jgi:hypothetical protein